MVVLPDGSFKRPESRAKAYSIHVANARASYRCQVERRRRHTWHPHPKSDVAVFVDERDGQGWRLHERIDLAAEVSS